MKLNLFFLGLIGLIGQAAAGSFWCGIGCSSAEVACQGAAVASVIDEPEGSIACGVAYTACVTACNSRRRLHDGGEDRQHIKDHVNAVFTKEVCENPKITSSYPVGFRSLCRNFHKAGQKTLRHLIEPIKLADQELADGFPFDAGYDL